MDFSLNSSIPAANINLEKVEALNQKRTLAFFNHWAIHMVDFLNQFSSTCETKLNELDSKLQRTEDTLAILEAKLSSIPGLNDVKLPQEEMSATVKPISDTHPPDANKSLELDTSTTSHGDAGEAVPSASPTPNVAGSEDTPVEFTPISKDPRYSTYFKMVNVGVPPQAVKIKMASQGLDPALLDDPAAPAPEGAPENPGTSDSEGEESSWSD